MSTAPRTRKPVRTLQMPQQSTLLDDLGTLAALMENETPGDPRPVPKYLAAQIACKEAIDRRSKKK